MTWCALIDDADGRVQAVIDEILVALAPRACRTLNEAVDRALLHAYLEVEDEGAALAAVIDVLASGGHTLGLYGGMARVGWALAHLSEGEAADAVHDVIAGAIDRALDVASYAEYDLISGLCGFGVYALERGDAGLRLANRVLDHLERTARPAESGLFWHTPPELLPAWQREQAPDGYHNLGLAHGIAGVVGLMARYTSRGIEVERAAVLLGGAMAHLLDVPPRAAGVARFPSWLPASEPTRMRVAWCYNDLGVSAALLSAAHSTGNIAWQAEAIDVALACAACPVAESGVRDAGLCHGALGNAHIFNRLWQATRVEALRVAACNWLDHGLAMRNARPIAGFPAARIEGGAIQWDADPGLLMGATGVALMLSAAITHGAEPRWDRTMLADHQITTRRR